MISSGTFPEIARWWRKRQNNAKATWVSEQDHGRDNNQKTISTNPRTLLLSVTRSQDGLDFIRGRVRSLRKHLRTHDDPQSRFTLALYLEKMGEDHFEEALGEMDHALARMPRDCGWAKSERVRLAKALDSLRAREQALIEARGSQATALAVHESEVVGATVPDGGGKKRPRQGEGPAEYRGPPLPPLPPLSRPHGSPWALFKTIDERIASTLTYEEFIENYALRGRPVVLKGGVSLCFEGGQGWSRDMLRAEAGHKMVPVRRWVPCSVSWARLEEAGQMPLRRLLAPSAVSATSDTSGHGSPPANGIGDAAVTGQPNMDGDPLYLHDWSIPQNLGSDSPLLAGRFQVPKFFAGDLLQRMAGRGLPYTDSWPSLFVGPKGSRSDTHIDSFGSHFWMGLLEGRKRWLLYPKQDAPLLYPVWPEGCHDPVFDADLDSPDAVLTPAALLARGFSCILEAGDLLFVPAGCPHRVENLTDTLALSCNYVDATNIDMSVAALKDQAFTDSQAAALASSLVNCNRHLVRRQREVPWADLKTWPREGQVADWLPISKTQ